MTKLQLRELIKETIDEILNGDSQSNVTEALSSSQRKYASDNNLTDDEYRVNMILAKAGFESLSTDFNGYSKPVNFSANRSKITGDMRKLINVATLESSRIRDIKKAAARGDAAVSLADKYDFVDTMKEAALTVAGIFYAQANKLNGGGNIFRV